MNVRRLYHRLLGKALNNFLQHYLLLQPLVYGDRSRLSIAQTAIVNNGLFNLACGAIIVEDYVGFGHNVVVLTGIHDYTQIDQARWDAVPASGRDVVIKRGAWIATNATIVGPCTIGEHAVVAAGAVVTGDVAPYTIVGGIPAKFIKTIERADAAGASH